MFLGAMRDLGMAHGLRHPTRTTFNDDGLVTDASPLRRAYSYMEPTLVGMLAGSMRLLRDPHVVVALSDSNPMVAHLFNLYATNLAAIFGDTDTTNAVKSRLATAHQRVVRRQELPDWFETATGQRNDFMVGNSRLTAAVVSAITAAIARVHIDTGVLQVSDGNTYCYDAKRTLGRVNGVLLSIPTTDDLLAAGNEYAGVALMNKPQLRTAGVLEVLRAILQTPLGKNLTVADLAHLFTPAMWPEDRIALGLEQPMASYRDWCNAYRWRLIEEGTTHDNPAATGSLGLFTVSLRVDAD